MISGPKQGNYICPTKRECYRLVIRQKQINSIKNKIRAKFMEQIGEKDKKQLLGINLVQVISFCKRQGLDQERIHELFLYATCENYQHLFELTDDQFINLLIDDLGKEVEQMFYNPSSSRKDLLKKRKIFWILTNYTSFFQQINTNYLLILTKLSKMHLVEGQLQSLIALQIEQNIVLSLSNLMINPKNCRYIMEHHFQLLNIVINRMINQQKTIKELILSAEKSVKKIITYYCELLHNFYSSIQYGQISATTQKSLVRLILTILNSFIEGNSLIYEENKKVIVLLLDSLELLFGYSLDNNPHLILKFKKQITSIGKWAQKFLKTQQESANSNEVIVAYVKFLKVIYGPNIPEQIAPQVDKFFKKHFQNHTGRVCTALFLHKNPLFHNQILRLLQPIFLEESLSELIFNQYLPIISHIFYHIKNSSFILKKQAFFCVVNFLKSALYENSSCINQILEILYANQIADVFAFNLWKFTQEELNVELLEGIEILLEAETNQYQGKINFRLNFMEAGGQLKIQQILQETKSELLKTKSLSVLCLLQPQEAIQ